MCFSPQPAITKRRFAKKLKEGGPKCCNPKRSRMVTTPIYNKFLEQDEHEKGLHEAKTTFIFQLPIIQHKKQTHIHTH